jgi:hypothetical protein
MFSSSRSREEIKRTSGRSPFCLSGLAVRKLDPLGISPITRKMTSHSKRSPSPARLNQFAADAIFRVVFFAKLIVACGAESIDSISHSHIPKKTSGCCCCCVCVHLMALVFPAVWRRPSLLSGASESVLHAQNSPLTEL